MQSSKEQQGETRKPFSVINAKNWRKEKGKTRDPFENIRDTKGKFHAKIDTIKDRNGRDLTEAEDTKKRWWEYTEKPYKKNLNDPNIHDGMITYLEPDILESKVRWARGSINMNKASGGDGISIELFLAERWCC